MSGRRDVTGGGVGCEAGSAAVEFLAVGVVLLVPLLYLALCLGRVQAAVFAAEGGAREAARVVAGAPGAAAQERAAAVVELAAADQGFAVAGERALRLECAADPCATPGSDVVARVRLEVPLPLVPAWLGRRVPAVVPVEVVRVAVVDRFLPAGGAP